MKEITISLMYVFRQFAKFFSDRYSTTLAGNVDPFYLFGVLYVLRERRKKRILEAFIVVVGLASYALLQFLIIDQLSVPKMIINVIKIFICYLVFRYAVDNADRFDAGKIIISTTCLFALLTIFALIFSGTDVFWRLNDFVNNFTQTRLQLFYVEPSELGYHLLLIMLPLGGIFMLSKSCGVKIASIALVLVNAIVLYLAMPMGAIAIGAVAVFIMIAYDFILRPDKNKMRIYQIFFVMGFLALWVLIYIGNPLVMRIIFTLMGEDSSSNYRVGLSFNVLKHSLVDYNFIGCGFGNQNTEQFIESYSDLGMVQVVVNSFIYFIIETGILGIIVIGTIIAVLIIKSVKDKSVIKLGLSGFIIIYSFLGGHFTSALTWIAYGVICSKIKDEDIVEQFEKMYQYLKVNLFEKRLKPMFSHKSERKGI